MVVAFWGVSALLVLTPCVDWAYVISAGLGRRSGVLPAVLGVLTGHVLATFAVAAGVAALVAASPVTMTVLTFAGSGYMSWLGVQTLRHPPSGDLETAGVIRGFRRPPDEAMPRGTKLPAQHECVVDSASKQVH